VSEAGWETVLEFDECHVGQRVRHTACGPGTVTARGETVDVRFDHVGKSGRYDRDWFRHAQCRLTAIRDGK
jgi:hypothetical protein